MLKELILCIHYDHSNPTPNTNTRIWRKYTTDDNYIEYLDDNEIDEKELYKRSKRIAFWTQLLPKIASKKSLIPNTIPTELQKSPGDINIDNLAVYSNIFFRRSCSWLQTWSVCINRLSTSPSSFVVNMHFFT